MDFDTTDVPTCITCLKCSAEVLKWMLGRGVGDVGPSCLLGKIKSPEYKRRRVFKKLCWREPEIETEVNVIWESCFAVMTGKPEQPQVRREKMIAHQIRHDRRRHAATIRCEETSQGALSHLRPKTKDADLFRTHDRKTTFGKLVVQSGESIADI